LRELREQGGGKEKREGRGGEEGGKVARGGKKGEGKIGLVE
jgi:hypothetical protein